MQRSDKVAIRPALPEDAPGIARVQVDTWRSAYEGIVSGTFLNELSYEGRSNYWLGFLTDPEYKGYIYVAESATHEVVGFAAAGPAQNTTAGYDGELYTIYILESYQGHRLGSRLAATAVKRLVEAGYKSLLIWVFNENPARRFYETLGGQEVGEQSFRLGGAEIAEVSYGWDDIKTFPMEAANE